VKNARGGGGKKNHKHAGPFQQPIFCQEGMVPGEEKAQSPIKQRGKPPAAMKGKGKRGLPGKLVDGPFQRGKEEKNKRAKEKRRKKIKFLWLSTSSRGGKKKTLFYIAKKKGI